MPLIKTLLNLSGFKAAIQNRQLLKQLTQRRLSQEHKNTVLGKVWMIVNPIAMLGLYVFVFGYIFGGKFKETEGATQISYAFGVFLGLTTIHFVTEILAIAPRCVADNESLVRRTTIPIELIPISITLTSLVHFCIGLALCVIGLFSFGHPLTLNALWALPFIVCLAFLGLGIAYIAAVLGAYLRDITQAIPVLSMGILFSSAVFYPVDKIPPQAWTILKFNPVLHFVDTMRSTILWGEPIESTKLMFLLPAASFGIYFGGFILFKSLQRRLADLI